MHARTHERALPPARARALMLSLRRCRRHARPLCAAVRLWRWRARRSCLALTRLWCRPCHALTQIPYIKADIPIFILFRALGFVVRGPAICGYICWRPELLQLAHFAAMAALWCVAPFRFVPPPTSTCTRLHSVHLHPAQR